MTVACDHAAQSARKLISDKLVEIAPAGAPHLIGGRCRACGAFSFPRAEVCSECLSLDVEAVRLPSEGTLYSYTVVHQAPKGWTTPYALGYVDLPDGVRVLGHIDAPHAALAVGLKVRLSLGVVASDAEGTALSTYTFVQA